MRETTLFLSPHLDDVVLSCPGRVLSEVTRGRRVIVATLFTGTDGQPDQRILYQHRLEEDRRAVESLGAATRWLDLPDAPFRHPFYSSFRAIVFETHPDDEGYIPEVAAAIHSLCAEVGPGSLHVPLGVGTHIDHRLTHASVELLIETGRFDPAVVHYYEDRPYAFVRHHVKMRLAELGTRCAEPPPPDLEARPAGDLTAEFLASFDATPYVNSYLPPGAERSWCRRRLVERLTQTPPGPRVRRPDVLTLEAADFQRCTRAVAAYESQIGELFGSVEIYVEAARAYTRLLDLRAIYAEREWVG